MSLKCYFQYEGGRFCKNWAQTGSRFCNNHQPQGLGGPPGSSSGDGWPMLHPLARLAMPSDLFDLVRETLNAARLGKITPSQAFAISSLAALWLKVYDKLEIQARLHALDEQILPSLVDAESAAHAERLQAASAECERRATEESSLQEPFMLSPDPWAAGRMAGPVPAGTPAAPVDLAEAQARLEALLAAKPPSAPAPLEIPRDSARTASG